MITVLIIEDDKPSLEYLVSLLRDFPTFNIVGTADNPMDAKELMISLNPELVFLDVELPGKSGFDILREMKEYPISPAVIFVTAFEKYAIEAIRNAAFDYLLKPLDPEELRKALERYVAFNNSEFRKGIERLVENLDRKKKMQFNIRSGIVFIDPNDIMYCEADGNYTSVHLDDKRMEYLTCQLGNLLERISTEDFIRLGRSLAINRRFITRLDRIRKQLVLEKGEASLQINLSAKQVRELNTILDLH